MNAAHTYAATFRPVTRSTFHAVKVGDIVEFYGITHATRCTVKAIGRFDLLLVPCCDSASTGFVTNWRKCSDPL